MRHILSTVRNNSEINESIDGNGGSHLSLVIKKKQNKINQNFND